MMASLSSLYGFAIVIAAIAWASGAQAQCDRPIGPDDFCGTYRAGPKTGYVKAGDGMIAPFQDVGGVSNLLDTLLSTDDDMRSRYDWGLNSAPANRVSEEMHNVELNAYVVAVKPCESDRDYHVIIKDESAMRYMNVEVSGLPTDGPDLNTFKNARSQIEQVLGDGGASNTCGTYNRPPQPIHVHIKGSVYFDGDHRAGCVQGCPGPSYAKPSTVWEIHPVYSIAEIP
jgi:hypothetical protein